MNVNDKNISISLRKRQIHVWLHYIPFIKITALIHLKLMFRKPICYTDTCKLEFLWVDSVSRAHSVKLLKMCL